MFRNFKKERKITVIHKHERKRISIRGIQYEQLSVIYDKDEEHAIEAFMICIKPGEMRGEKHYGHIGKELGIILEGKGRLEYGDKTYNLDEGDSIVFSSDVPHVLVNTGTEILKAVWVSTPPRLEYMQDE